MVSRKKGKVQEKMEADEVTSGEIIRLTESFAAAVKDADKDSLRRIAADDLKIEFKLLGDGQIRDFDENKLEEISFLRLVSDAAPQVLISRTEARLMYEVNSHCHLQDSDFQNGFIRQTYFYRFCENDWKLHYLKTEVRRFSGYNLKESLFGAIECLFVKATKNRWKINT